MGVKGDLDTGSGEDRSCLAAGLFKLAVLNFCSNVTRRNVSLAGTGGGFAGDETIGENSSYST